ncbi:MAG: hypothetical protein P8188_16315 [Gemmatimonadota bacterium]
MSLGKFVALSLLTFGLYELLWLYRSWHAVKRAEGSSIWPWARAVFAVVWLLPLLRRLQVGKPVELAVAYFLLAVSWRLPGAYWLISLFTFLPLIPAVLASNRKAGRAPPLPPSFAWRKRSTVVAVLGTMCLPLVLLGSLGPPTAVVDGRSLRQEDLTFLQESQLLAEGEEVLFFYSTGILSIRGEGAFASDLGITSYWTDPVSDELMVAYLPYHEILDVEVSYSTHPLEDTSVRVYGPDDAWFTFFLSPEEGGDRRFLEEVERRRTASSTWSASA